MKKHIRFDYIMVSFFFLSTFSCVESQRTSNTPLKDTEGPDAGPDAGDTEAPDCPNDPDKDEPGVCGCGTPDEDSDGDGTADCIDLCKDDPNKTEPLQCGCGIAENDTTTDTDGDGTIDCEDACRLDPQKTEPGSCGCGMPEGPFDHTCRGLTATYYNEPDLSDEVFQRIDPTVDFVWNLGSPDDRIDPDTFSVSWQGSIESEFSNVYTFYTLSDNGVRLEVNGTKIINHWEKGALTERSGTITLNAGKFYTIKLEYFTADGGAKIQLFWKSPSQPRQIIPQSRLFTAVKQ